MNTEEGFQELKEQHQKMLETIGRMLVHMDQLERDNRMLTQAMCSILNKDEEKKRIPPPVLRRYTPYIADDTYLQDNPEVESNYPEFSELVTKYRSDSFGDEGLLMKKHFRNPMNVQKV